MNDAMEKTASSLAIVEKKPQRSGGCVGIFFQLFDWNRRFAKKKLFSKKLLPPVRLKQASKKFGGDEKRPKLRLIVDENSGGFPNANKKNGATTKVDHEQRHEMRSPSLVARLMGLESMPALHREKSKKFPLADFANDKAENGLDEVFRYPKKELNVEKGGIKDEVRPQKLQKTSCSESLSMTRFGTDTLPLKNVLSRSKKHQPKLPVPVKNPNNLSRKNSSKLISAATRILEPGLQTSRSKCALTYSNTSHHPPKLNVSMEDSDNIASLGWKGHQSCRNCGHSLDDDFGAPKHCTNEQPLFFTPPSNCVKISCQGLERSKQGRCMFYPEVEDLHDNNLQPCVEVTSDMSSSSGQMQPNFSSQQPKPLKDLPSSLRSKNQMLQANATIPPRSKFNGLSSNTGSTAADINKQRNFVSLNRSTNGTTRMEICRFEMEKRISQRQYELVSPGRKKRPTDIPRKGEGSVFTSSTGRKQACSTPHAISSKDFGYNMHSVKLQSRKSGLPHLQHRTVGSSQTDNNVVPFTFNSPAKQNTRLHVVEKRRVQNNSGRGGSTQKSALIENSGNRFAKPLPLSGDALGALLEQKLKELTSQGEDMGSNTPRKTSAMILQELISALTLEMPFLEKIPIRNRNHLFNPTPYTSSQANAMAAKLSVDQPLESEHLSPGSVLETFSNESYLSSSHEDNLGYKMSNESVDYCSSSEPRPFNPDNMELSDSANSITGAKSSKELVIDILNIVSETLCCINLAHYGLKGSKLDHTKEVLLNSELMLQNASHLGSSVQRDSLIKHLLIDEMETLATVLWMNFGPSLGVEDCEEVDQLTRFALDSIMEYLDSRFERYLISGSKLSTKLPLCMNTNVLIFEVVEEVRRWNELSGSVLDELIDIEMNHSLTKWTQFESEIFETGMEISKQVFQVLLNELVIDLCY